MNAPLALPPPDDELNALWAKEAAQDAQSMGQLPQVDLSMEKTIEGDFAIIPRLPNGQPIASQFPARVVKHSPTGTAKLYMPTGGMFGTTDIDTGTGSFGNFTNSSLASTSLITNQTTPSGTAITGVWGQASVSIISGSSVSVQSSVLTSIGAGCPANLRLPDGGRLIVDEDGSYRIEDKDAKITYRAARVRDFNPYLNASDMLGDFIEDLAKLTPIPADKALQVPIEVFINWLITRAAKADGVEPPTDLPPLQQVALIPPSAQPPPKREPIRCGHCGRFVSRKKADIGLRFCSGHHADLFLARPSRVPA